MNSFDVAAVGALRGGGRLRRLTLTRADLLALLLARASEAALVE
jgi:hypothetical protein